MWTNMTRFYGKSQAYRELLQDVREKTGTVVILAITQKNISFGINENQTSSHLG